MAIEFRQPCIEEQKIIESIFVRDISNDSFSIIALDGDSIAGYVGAGRSANYASLNHLFVLPEFERSGLKGQLLQELLSCVRADGLEKTHLFSMNFKNSDFSKDYHLCSL